MDFWGSSSSHNYSQLLTETTLKIKKKKKSLKSQLFDDSENQSSWVGCRKGKLELSDSY